MNTDASWPTLKQAWPRVLEMQAKLHQWAVENPDRQFGDIYNLIYDPAFLTVAWSRVKGNRGARSAGIDGEIPRQIDNSEQRFLIGLRANLKARSFKPLPVKQRLIPKGNGKLRSLGIPTASDRVVQASLKLVLEPIFEADFQPCSYGFRPNRRTQDAIVEIRHFAAKSYEYILEADIDGCFDNIDHVALMDCIRRRIKDRKVLALVKSFLHAGVLNTDGHVIGTKTGTPQGGILSPLLANIALSVLDDHFMNVWNNEMATSSARQGLRNRGLPSYRLVRYADDFVLLVTRSRDHAVHLKQQVADVLGPMGLKLSEHKTRVVSIDEGLDFLGFRIQRQLKQGTVRKRHIYVYPSKQSLASVKSKIRLITRQGYNGTLGELLARLSPVLRGWTTYFRHGHSKDTFSYLRAFVWKRVGLWARRKHDVRWSKVNRRYYQRGWWPKDGDVVLFNPSSVRITRYSYKGYSIASPWTKAVRKLLPTA